MSSSTPNSESDLRTATQPLINLIRHKLRNTFPPLSPDGHSIFTTFQLNRAIRKRTQSINASGLVDATGSEDLKQAFAELERLAIGWHYGGGGELTDKVALTSTTRQVVVAINSLGGKDKDRKDKDEEGKDEKEKDEEEKNEKGKDEEEKEKDDQEKVEKGKDEKEGGSSVDV